MAPSRSLALSSLLLPFAFILVAGQYSAQNVQREPVSEACLGCICEASSGCNTTLTCSGDVCGVFRITWAYWADAGKPVNPGEDPNSAEAYSRCTNDPTCAAQTVINYMNKYGQDCNGDGQINCYDYAAIHKLGRIGCSGLGAENPYYQKFDQCARLIYGQSAGPLPPTQPAQPTYPSAQGQTPFSAESQHFGQQVQQRPHYPSQFPSQYPQYPPQYPNKPQLPPYKPQRPEYKPPQQLPYPQQPSLPQQPYPPQPSLPQQPSFPQQPSYPQKPTYPQKPSYPQPPQPQNPFPQQPTYPQPQQPQETYPQPQQPQQPQETYPQPQQPQQPQETYPQPQQPSGSGSYPQPPFPPNNQQYPQPPQLPQKPPQQVFQPQLPTNPTYQPGQQQFQPKPPVGYPQPAPQQPSGGYGNSLAENYELSPTPAVVVQTGEGSESNPDAFVYPTAETQIAQFARIGY